MYGEYRSRGIGTGGRSARDSRQFRSSRRIRVTFDTTVDRASIRRIASSQRFSTVTCTHCRYTEIYQADTSMLGNIFDLFTN